MRGHVLLLAVLLAACGRETSSPSTPPASGSPDAPVASTVAPTSPAEAAAARRIEADVRFLADDLLEGREAGTRGYDLAARYVAARYAALGLEPLGDGGSWFQKVPLVRGQREAEGARFAIVRDGVATEFAFEADFLPDVHYTTGAFEVQAPAVFVGYGVHAPELSYDDFASIDVRGKVALLFPNAPSKFPNDQRAYYSSRATKMAELEKRGAVGVVWLGDPKDEARRPWAQGAANWRRVGMRLVGADAKAVDDFPAVAGRASVRADLAKPLFAGAPQEAEQVHVQLAKGELTSFDLPIEIALAGRATLTPVETANVVARFRGSDAALANEHVVFTAHLDHVGIGAPVDGDAIYNGALDNALGVAILLEAARAFSLAEAPKRSIVFVALTAEEKGLLGAEHYARSPTVPLDSIVANVNMDMPILLEPLPDVVPTGIEHSTLDAVVADAAKELGITVSPDPVPEEVVFVRSDQYPFIKQGIPAVYLNGGVTPKLREFLTQHYHLPSDEPDLPIDYPTAARLAAINERIGARIANAAERPRWKDGDFFGEKFGRR